MGCERFQIGVREPVVARMILRHWSREELLQNLPWLKAQNAQGCDIYIVPNEPSGLVLLDDLTLGRVQALSGQGLFPCCVALTSPENYQAWVRLTAEPLDPPVLKEAVKRLTLAFHGDRSSVGWKHFGRLAGFQNKKPKHKDKHGKSPWVLLYDAQGGVAPSGQDIVQQVRESLLHAPSHIPKSFGETISADGPDPAERFRQGVRKLQDVYGGHFDASIADFKIARAMAKEGFTHREISEAMRQASPGIEVRKVGRVAAYIELTTTNACRTIAG